MAQAVSKTKKLREMAPDLHISADGGVNDCNAAELVEAGANVLVAGGGIFKADDKCAAINSLTACVGSQSGIGSPTLSPPY
jgi:ribulose-phosphate 3-epimerase